jgi:hypothetical protein
VAALVEVAWMVTGCGLYARGLELPDFSARHDAPGSIAGHRRGVPDKIFEVAEGGLTDPVSAGGRQFPGATIPCNGTAKVEYCARG